MKQLNEDEYLEIIYNTDIKELLNVCNTSVLREICKENSQSIAKNMLKKYGVVPLNNITEQKNYYTRIFRELLAKGYFEKNGIYKFWNHYTKGHVSYIKKYIHEYGIPINYFSKKNNEEKISPLTIAFSNNNKFAINDLLDLNVDVNFVDSSNTTILFRCFDLETGFDNDIFNRIIEKYTLDINLQNYFGTTILMRVSMNNFINIGYGRNQSLIVMNKILDYNPDINLQDFQGDTALMILINKSGFNFNNLNLIIGRMLNLNANINLQNNKGHTALTYAIINELVSNENINIMIDNADLNLNLVDQSKKSVVPIILFLIRHIDDNEILNKILDLNPELNVVDSNGRHFIKYAFNFQENNIEILNKILDKIDLSQLDDEIIIYISNEKKKLPLEIKNRLESMGL